MIWLYFRKYFILKGLSENRPQTTGYFAHTLQSSWLVKAAVLLGSLLTVLSASYFILKYLAKCSNLQLFKHDSQNAKEIEQHS